jgi:hypothetical protein
MQLRTIPDLDRLRGASHKPEPAAPQPAKPTPKPKPIPELRIECAPIEEILKNIEAKLKRWSDQPPDETS